MGFNRGQLLEKIKKVLKTHGAKKQKTKKTMGLSVTGHLGTSEAEGRFAHVDSQCAV